MDSNEINKIIYQSEEKAERTQRYDGDESQATH